MEFGEIFLTNIITHPRGEEIVSEAPYHQKGVSWTSKYGYVALTDHAGQIMDGFNEKGLSVGLLWFPDSIYPDVSTTDPDTIINYTDLAPWMLGNFSTVHQVRAALPSLNVYASFIPLFNTIPGIHFAIHDAEGNNLVVEFLNGEMHIFDNVVGVLTNSPEFPWQVTNLRNYINLSDLNANTITLDGTVLSPTGQGSGLLGIPGDWTPPSRFVRIAMIKNFIPTPAHAQEGVITALHLINMVDIPYGAIRSTESIGTDFTQWAIVKDLKNSKLYYRTYEDQNIHEFELKPAHSQKGAKQVKIPIPVKPIKDY